MSQPSSPRSTRLLLSTTSTSKLRAKVARPRRRRPRPKQGPGMIKPFNYLHRRGDQDCCPPGIHLNFGKGRTLLFIYSSVRTKSGLFCMDYGSFLFFFLFSLIISSSYGRDMGLFSLGSLVVFTWNGSKSLPMTRKALKVVGFF